MVQERSPTWGGMAAQEIIGNTNFGAQAQALKPLAELQAGTVRLG